MTTLALNRSVSRDQLFSEKLKAATEKSQEATRPSPAGTPLLLRAWQWLQTKFQARTAGKPLELTGTLALGEKRTIFVVQVSGRKFLVGGTPTSLVMLADLGPIDGSTETALVPAAQPGIRKERRRRSSPARLPESASLQPAPPIAAKTAPAPRRTRKKVVVEPEQIAVW